MSYPTDPIDDDLEAPDPDQPDRFPDEGSGPQEPDDALDDPENQAAAKAIRDSTIERNRDRGHESTFETRG